MAKFGEFSCARLKPTWEDTSAASRDHDGDKLRTDRGARGFGRATDGEAFFMKSADPAFDKIAYGSGPRKRRADAIEDLTDRFKGSKGVDSGDDGHGDDGVRR
jgi:hypothetical protein